LAPAMPLATAEHQAPASALVRPSKGGWIVVARGPALNPAQPPDRPGLNLLTGYS
jgi:hypothetical protein